MRNLKKILALVLALVMSFSLMATANAFTDSEKITDTYETAVTVLDGLKVFQGYEDGSFRPQDAIKRSEVAAIIYRIVTGDVTDAQVGIYADYNKFDDVKSTSWYAGYVNFCANAEYIKGRDARTFDPDSYVTGYEALAMILRAIGYDKNGEFTGSSWQVQTAATGELRGITKNITEGTLGTYASREVVAEILFQTILVDKVNYTPAFGYRLDDTSLGWDTFELESIEGVVVANEYADLYSEEALRDGRTELNVDGESYILNYTSTLEDIGEAREAYITEGENVLYLADAGNTVFETGAASDIEKDDDFEEVTGLERDKDLTEQFINFDGGLEYEAADRVIRYELDCVAYDATWTDWDGYRLERVNKGTYDEVHSTYSKTIKAGQTVTATDLRLIKAIFAGSDEPLKAEYIGEVFVGTQSDEDISDTISYKEFEEKYIETNENAIAINETDNGEWLKVIDNDNDGVADVVLLTEFAMSVIDRISDDNEYTLSDLAGDDQVSFDRNTVKIDGDAIATEDELAEEDVVIYTLIDGVYYMNIAEMVTETIDEGREAINSKTETITCDGTDYVQSHIGYTDESAYEWDVTEAETETTYDLYLDHFGYVRLFVESDYNVFMLLTDGWYEDDNRTETFQAYYWDVDAGEETQIDVVDNDDASEFIADRNPTGWNGDQETWGRLKGADWTYLTGYDWRNTFATNIAGYGETADGYALKKVQDSTSREDYMVQQFVVNDDVALKDTYLEATDGRQNDIQTTSNTQYYLVIREEDNRTVSGWDVEDVITWTGYKNAPDGAKLNRDGIVVGYAVTHVTKSASKSYNVADVVVFETLAYNDRDTYFVYARNNAHLEHVWGIGYDEDSTIQDQRINAESGIGDMIRFYEINDEGVADEIGRNDAPFIDDKGDYAAHDIYAGFATTDWDIEGIDYIQVDTVADGKMNAEVDAPIYKVTRDSKGVYDVERMNRDDVHVGDAVIVFTDGSKDDNVEYVLFVGRLMQPLGGFYPTDRDLLPAMEALWLDISEDATPENYDDALTDALDAAKAALDDYEAYKAGTGTLTAAQVKTALENAQNGLNALTDADILATFDETQKAQLNNMLGRLKAPIADMETIIGEAVSAQEARKAMIEAWNAYAADTTDDDLLEAAFAAAADYKQYYGTTDGSPEADEAYGKAQGEADTLVAAVNALVANKAEDMEKAFYGRTPLVPVNADALAIADNSGKAVDNYNTKVAALQAAKADYDLARDLVAAYEAWDDAKTNDATTNKINELWKTLKAAYNAAVAAKVDKAFTDTDEKYFGSDTTSYDAAVNDIKAEIAAQPEEAVAELVLGGTRGDGNEKWKVEYENNVLIVGSGYNYSQFGVDNIGTWLVAGDDAVYDTTEGITWEVTTPADAEDYKVLTATFPGLNGGEDKSVDVTVRNATDAQKVAHDKALLEDALETVDVNLSKGSAEVTSAMLKTYMETRISNAYNALTTDWGSTITVTVTVNTPYDAPAAGDKVDYSAAVEITIESGAAEDTLTLTIAGTVENTDAL